MADAAEQSARDALNINSPSKVFMAIGSGVVEGFVKGIHENVSNAANSASEMASATTKTFSKAISRVSDVLNSDMDAQPTIRPVLDLSEVGTGAKTVGSMFGNPSLGVMSNFGSISRNMNSRNQNGANDDVVSAINKLGTLLGNGGNNYTINGITYNDDTPIAEAVSALIRATIIEGRA